MIFVYLIFALSAYMIIGIMLSMSWVDRAIKEAGEDWDPWRYMMRCSLKWPVMIANPDIRYK